MKCFQAFWLKTDFNKWKDEDESDDELDRNMDLAEVIPLSVFNSRRPYLCERRYK